jgi:hypothetical protein
MYDRPGLAAAKLRPTDLVSSWYTQKLLALTILKVPVLYDRSILSYVSSLFDSIDNNNNHNGIHSSTRTNPVSLKIPGSLVPVITLMINARSLSLAFQSSSNRSSRPRRNRESSTLTNVSYRRAIKKRSLFARSAQTQCPKLILKTSCRMVR